MTRCTHVCICVFQQLLVITDTHDKLSEPALVSASLMKTLGRTLQKVEEGSRELSVEDYVKQVQSHEAEMKSAFAKDFPKVAAFDRHVRTVLAKKGMRPLTHSMGMGPTLSRCVLWCRRV